LDQVGGKMFYITYYVKIINIYNIECTCGV